MPFKYLQKSFSRGILSPNCLTRQNIQGYNEAARDLYNLLIGRQGEAYKRGGLGLMAGFNKKPQRIIPFKTEEGSYLVVFFAGRLTNSRSRNKVVVDNIKIFNVQDSRFLEQESSDFSLGNFYSSSDIKMFGRGSQEDIEIFDPYSIDVYFGYTADELQGMSFTQIGDLLICCGESFPPFVIRKEDDEFVYYRNFLDMIANGDDIELSNRAIQKAAQSLPYSFYGYRLSNVRAYYNSSDNTERFIGYLDLNVNYDQRGLSPSNLKFWKNRAFLVSTYDETTSETDNLGITIYAGMIYKVEIEPGGYPSKYKVTGEIKSFNGESDLETAWSADKSANLYLCDWSERLGFPKSVTTYENRIVFASTKAYPEKIWFSAQPSIQKVQVGTKENYSYASAGNDARVESRTIEPLTRTVYMEQTDFFNVDQVANGLLPQQASSSGSVFVNDKLSFNIHWVEGGEVLYVGTDIGVFTSLGTQVSNNNPVPFNSGFQKPIEVPVKRVEPLLADEQLFFVTEDNSVNMIMPKGGRDGLEMIYLDDFSREIVRDVWTRKRLNKVLSIKDYVLNPAYTENNSVNFSTIESPDFDIIIDKYSKVHGTKNDFVVIGKKGSSSGSATIPEVGSEATSNTSLFYLQFAPVGTYDQEDFLLVGDGGVIIKTGEHTFSDNRVGPREVYFDQNLIWFDFENSNDFNDTLFSTDTPFPVYDLTQRTSGRGTMLYETYDDISAITYTPIFIDKRTGGLVGATSVHGLSLGGVPPDTSIGRAWGQFFQSNSLYIIAAVSEAEMDKGNYVYWTLNSGNMTNNDLNVDRLFPTFPTNYGTNSAPRIEDLRYFRTSFTQPGQTAATGVKFAVSKVTNTNSVLTKSAVTLSQDIDYNDEFSSTGNQNSVVIFGGKSGSEYKSDFIVINGTTITNYNRTGATISPRTGALVLGTNTTGVIIGGYSGSVYLNDIYKYDVSGSNVNFTALTVDTAGASLPLISGASGRGDVALGLFFGGRNESGYLNDFYRYSVTGSQITFTKLTLTYTGRVGQEGLKRQNCSFVGSMTEGVLFGGYNGSFLNDFHIYTATSNAVTIVQSENNLAIEAREAASLLGDKDSGVLFGGFGNMDYSDFHGYVVSTESSGGDKIIERTSLLEENSYSVFNSNTRLLYDWSRKVLFVFRKEENTLGEFVSLPYLACNISKSTGVFGWSRGDMQLEDATFISSMPYKPPEIFPTVFGIKGNNIVMLSQGLHNAKGTFMRNLPNNLDDFIIVKGDEVNRKELKISLMRLGYRNTDVITIASDEGVRYKGTLEDLNTDYNVKNGYYIVGKPYQFYLRTWSPTTERDSLMGRSIQLQKISFYAIRLTELEINGDYVQNEFRDTAKNLIQGGQFTRQIVIQTRQQYDPFLEIRSDSPYPFAISGYVLDCERGQ